MYGGQGFRPLRSEKHSLPDWFARLTCLLDYEQLHRSSWPKAADVADVCATNAFQVVFQPPAIFSYFGPKPLTNGDSGTLFECEVLHIWKTTNRSGLLITSMPLFT
jgi:hypothetical protein